MTDDTMVERMARVACAVINPGDSWDDFDESYHQLMRDAVQDAWPEFEALVREAQAEAVEQFAASVNLHAQAPDDIAETFGLPETVDLCGDDPAPCLFWQMTYALRDELEARAATYRTGDDHAR